MNIVALPAVDFRYGPCGAVGVRSACGGTSFRVQNDEVDLLGLPAVFEEWRNSGVDSFSSRFLFTESGGLSAPMISGPWVESTNCSAMEDNATGKKVSLVCLF